MKEKTKYLITFAMILVVVSAASAAIMMNEMNNNNKDSFKDSYSFEEDFEGWEKDGTDLDDPPINWSIDRSKNYSTDGIYSLRFYIENFNDAGKIWVEKTFDVDPNSLYEIKISYDFATSDYGEFNLFKIITSVLGGSFKGRDSLNYVDDTGHHSDAEGVVWLEKEYDYIVETDEKGEIYINFGIWGSWETTRTYYFDNISITFEKQEEIDEYPDISGEWALKHYNWEGNMTNQENITITQNESKIKIEFELGISTEGIITKNNIENPYVDSEFIIKGCDFRGLGINIIYLINETYMITEIPSCETCNPSIFTK